MKKLIHFRTLMVITILMLANFAWATWTPSTVCTYSIAYSVNPWAPQDNRGIAVSNDGQYLYLGYNTGTTFKRIQLSTKTQLGGNTTDRAKSIAVDDQGRVYEAGPDGNPIKIYNSDLSVLQYSIATNKCEGLFVKREGTNLYLYATERNLGQLKRFILTESGGAITGAVLNGLDGDGIVSVSTVSPTRGLTGVLVGSDNKIYITDPGNGSGNGRICRLNNDGSGQTNFTFLGANNPYYMSEISGQLFVTQGSYSTFPTRVAVINFSDMSFAGFITPDWAALNITKADSYDYMISGITAFPNNKGFYITCEHGKVTNPLSWEPVIKVSFPQTGPTTIAPKIVSSAATVTVPITVNSFFDVGAVSLKLVYNPAILHFAGFTIPAGSPLTGMTAEEAVDGITKVSWYNIVGQEMPDNSILINLNYTRLASGTTTLVWVDDDQGAACEYQNATTQNPYPDLPYPDYYLNGWVTDLAISLSGINPICPNYNNGSATAVATAGTSPYVSYVWSTTPPQTGATASGLIAGTYTCTVTDNLGAQNSGSITLVDKYVKNEMTSQYYSTIQAAIDAASNGDIISVCAGTYPENIIINKDITLNGANAGKQCGIDTRSAESVISATGGAAVTIMSDGVTLDGFEIVNQLGNYAVTSTGYNNLQIINNNIHNIGNTGPISNVHAIAIVMGDATTNNVQIIHNCIGDINSSYNDGSGSAVAVGWSNATTNITNLKIQHNIMANIWAKEAESGGKGAYGVIINVGALASGQAISPMVDHNTILNLHGKWAHGIGLEGNTPGAMITNNEISMLYSSKQPPDAIGVFVEQNTGAATVAINNNSFSTMPCGIASVMAPLVNGTCNWYALSVIAKSFGPISIIPWLTSGVDSDGGLPGFIPSVACAPCSNLSISATDVDVNCPLVPTGSINLTALGGVEPYSYSWTGPSYVSAVEDPNALFAGTYYVTVTALNGCSATTSVTLDLIDHPAPVVSPATGSNTVQCMADVAPPTPPVVTDDCGTTLTAILTSTVDAPPVIICEGTRTYTYTYTDYQGKTSTYVHVVNIDRTTPPAEFGGPVATASTVECLASAVAPTKPVVKDVCGNILNPKSGSPVIGGNSETCSGTGTKTYTYNYEDCSGLPYSWTYTYTFHHVTPPVVPLPGFEPITCPEQAVAPLSQPYPVLIQTPYPAYDVMFKAFMNSGTPNQQQPNFNNWILWQNTGVGQSFTPTVTEKLTQLDVYVYAKTGTPQFKLEIYLGDGKGGVPIYTEDGYSITTTGWVSLYLPVATAPTLTSGTQYTFWLTPYPLNYVQLGLGTPDPYAGGQSWDELPFPNSVVDVCGTAIPTPTPVRSGTYDLNGCEGTIIYTYNYTDCHGLNTPWVYTYTLERNDFTMPANGSSNIECVAGVTTPTPPEVRDNCNNLLTPTSGPALGGDFNGCKGTKTYTWTYADCEGNTHNWVYTYNILHVTPPAKPANGGITVECWASATPPTSLIPVVLDVCGTPLTAVLASTVDNLVNDGCSGTRTYTYTYTDCELLSTYWSYVYTIQHSTAPAKPLNGSISVECWDLATPPTSLIPVVLDVCGTPLTAVLTSTVDDPVTMGCSGSRTYTYTYTDCANLSTTWSYVYTILHVTAPTQIGTAVPTASTVECAPLTPTFALPVVQDVCGNIIPAPVPTATATPNCEGSKTYTYVYRDCAQLEYVWEYTYNIDHVTPPVVPPAGFTTVACVSQAVPPLSVQTCNPEYGPLEYPQYDCNFKTYMNNVLDQQLTQFSNWIMNVNTGVGQSFTPSVTGPLTQIDVNVYQLTGNPTFAVQVYVGNGKNGTPIYTAPGYSLNGTGWKTLTIPVGDAPTLTAGVKYTFWLTAYPYNSVVLGLGYPDLYLGGSAWDECQKPVVKDVCGTVIPTPDPVIGGTYNGCEGTKTYTYRYTDCSGLYTDWVYTYTIERNDFTMPDNGSSTVACYALAVTPQLPTITDNCGNTLTGILQPMGGTYVNCEGTVIYTYKYTDCEGNTHNWIYTYTIERLDFTMPNNGSSTVACVNQAVAPQLPEILDNCGNILAPTGLVVSDIPACEGTVSYTYTYTDCELNTHNWVYTYTIDDNLAPTISSCGLAKSAFANENCKASVPSFIGGVVATDNCGVSEITQSPIVGTEVTTGETIVTLTVKDCAGNITTCTNTFTVTDNTPPVLTGTLPGGAKGNLCKLNATPAPTEASIAALYTDNCTAVTATLYSSLVDGTDCNWTATYTYRIKDADNNYTTTNAVVVYTGGDTEAPTLVGTIPGGPSGNLCKSAATPAPSVASIAALYTDNCGIITANLISSVVAGTNCSWTATYTYTVKDACENYAANAVVVYTGGDTQAPILVGTIPGGPSGNLCKSAATPAPAVATIAALYTDNCGAVTASLFSSTVTGTDCNWTATYTYKVKDACENYAANAVVIYTGGDTEAPTWATPIFRRDMPTANVNNSAGANRSNVAWADGTNPYEIYGDDFTLGSSPTGFWSVSSVTVWGVAGDVNDPDFTLDDYFNNIYLMGNVAPVNSWTSPYTFANLQGTANFDTPLMSGQFNPNSNTTTSGINIKIEEVTYSNGQSYERSTPGLYKRIWKVTFSNLFWTVPAGQKILYSVMCTPKNPTDFTTHWYNHFSNIPLGLAPATSFDGLNLDIAPGTYPNKNIYAIDNSLPQQGWDKGNDNNVLVYGMPYGGTTVNTCKPAVALGPTAEDIITTFSDNCDQTLTGITWGQVAGDECNWISYRWYQITDDCGNIMEPNPTVYYKGGDKTTPVVSICPAPYNVTGCGTEAITGLLYKESSFTLTAAEFTAAGGVATDNCTSLSYSYVDTKSGTCPIIVSRVFTVTDACGNFTTCTQLITINAPAIVFNCGADVTVPACSTQAQVNDAYALFLASTTASGGCNGNLSNDAPAAAPSKCGGFVDVTWTYTSSCAPFTTTCTKRFTVIADNPPTITCPGDQIRCSNNNLAYSVKGTEFDPTVVDNCTYVLSNSFNGNPSLAAASLPNGPTTVTWTVTDNCGQTATCSFLVTINTCIISGNINYNNLGHSPMPGVGIQLTTPAKTIIGYSNANNSGYYSISPVPNGDYIIEIIDNPNLPIGSINSTDAAQANYWGTFGGDILHVKSIAGDVTEDDYMSSPDAQAIQLHFVNGSGFARGPWSYCHVGCTVNHNPIGSAELITVHVENGNITGKDILGQATGDVNGSNNLGSKGAPKVEFNYGYTILANADSRVDLPIRLVDGGQIGAISLILNFPSELLNVEEVIMSGTTEKPNWSVDGKELRIGWYSMNPLNLNAGDILMTIRLKTSSTFIDGQTASFSIVNNDLTELADQYYESIPLSILSISDLAGTSLGIAPVIANQLLLESFPNPFDQMTNIVYNLPFDGKVSLELYNPLGVKVRTLVNDSKKSGENTFRLDATKLAPGMYTLSLRLKGVSGESVRTIRLICTH